MTRSTKRRSRKPIVATVRECPHIPQTLVHLGAGVNPEGEIFYCPECRIIDKITYEEIESLNPLRFSRPLREKV